MSIYMSSYVRPNVVIKELQNIYKIPLYIDAKVLIKPNQQGLIKLTNVANEMNYKNMNLKDFDTNNLNTFEKNY